MPMLNVPHVSQWAAGANRYKNDCGPACVGMCLQYYGKMGVLTVDDLANETGLRTSDTGLLPAQLVTLARNHGLLAAVNNETTFGEIKTEIDAGRPVIALVAYRFILGRLDQADNVPGSDGHFFVIVGYDNDHFVINDPDYWVPYIEQGHNVLIPIAELDRGMAEYHDQCVFMGVNMTSNAEQIIQLLRQIEAIVGQLEVPPVPEPTPTTMWVISNGWINVRGAASTSATILGTIPEGTPVLVIPSDRPDWMKVSQAADVAQILRGGYMYKPLLSTTDPK